MNKRAIHWHRFLPISKNTKYTPFLLTSPLQIPFIVATCKADHFCLQTAQFRAGYRENPTNRGRQNALPVKSAPKAGFTLVEMSIMLVIIGLIVGGILTGQDLINAANIRAQLSQIERYQTAVRTFQGKYGYLPGDIPDPTASQFGFQARGTLAGQGDGNGIIEAQDSCSNSGTINGYANGCGELAMFWVDLSTAGLIDANIASQGAGYPSATTHGNATLTSTPSVYQWIPSAKLGPQSNFVYVFSHNGVNYFAVSSVTFFTWMVHSTANPGLTVQQAYNIDSKIDDGLPQSGSVNTCYTNYEAGGLNYGWVWAAGNLNVGWPGTQGCSASVTASAYAPTNCYDNNGMGGTQKYSITQNANVQNCALSFKFR